MLWEFADACASWLVEIVRKRVCIDAILLDVEMLKLGRMWGGRVARKWDDGDDCRTAKRGVGWNITMCFVLIEMAVALW